MEAQVAIPEDVVARIEQRQTTIEEHFKEMSNQMSMMIESFAKMHFPLDSHSTPLALSNSSSPDRAVNSTPASECIPRGVLKD